ncbi:MAG: UDP-N-acetylmuramate dehydrogenase [Spirochaetales bacterium]|nr:UDP-N-acetylmuramate dehydrogenase [Spirochaetales bacterium]
MDNLRNKLKKINIDGHLTFDEPMSKHTTFQTGGNADIFFSPANTTELKLVLDIAKKNEAEIYITGGGANLLVSDKGLKGIVINTNLLDSISIQKDGLLKCGAGVTVDNAAEAALNVSISGLDSFFGMPGTIGGALWMNARCYDKSISDIIISANYLDQDLQIHSIPKSEMCFDYKKSVFQSQKWIILDAIFELEKDDKDLIRAKMIKNKEDRKSKGHYSAPCAGSIFKNNRAFGKPSGVIIDSLNLRGTKIGGAAVSDYHANIIINSGNAKSSEIKELITLIQDKVKKAYDFILEPEVQFIGDF